MLNGTCDEYSAIGKAYCNNFRYEVESNFVSGYFHRCEYSKSNYLQSIITLRTNEWLFEK